MAYELIRLKKDLISRLTLNNPKKSNAFTHRMIEEMMDALRIVESDPECMVVILDHEGPVFSAGHDLTDEIPVGSPPATQETWREFLEWARNAFYLPLYDYNKPIICKIDGRAVAGGTDLLCFADLCYCSDESFFTWHPIAQMTVATSPSQALFWKVGPWKCNDLLFGMGWTGPEAERNGLVEKSVPKSELEDFVMERARLMAKVIPEAARFNKFIMRFMKNRLGVRDAIVFGSEMDILGHMHSADKQFTDIMREEGMHGVIRLAKEKVAAR